MNDAIKTVVLPNWIYLEFVISSLISLAIYVVMVIKVFKRTASLIFIVISFFLSLIIASPAVVSYTIITQLDIFPRHVKFIEMDFSGLKNDLAAINDIRDIALKHGGSCVNNVCTMKVLSFKHNINETWVKFGKESNDEFYCNCSSPIDYEFGKNALVAKVKI